MTNFNPEVIMIASEYAYDIGRQLGELTTDDLYVGSSSHTGKDEDDNECLFFENKACTSDVDINVVLVVKTIDTPCSKWDSMITLAVIMHHKNYDDRKYVRSRTIKSVIDIYGSSTQQVVNMIMDDIGAFMNGYVKGD